MYRYLQETTAKKAKWKVVPDMAKFKGYFNECAMVTVLAVSEQREPTDSENPTQEIDGIDPLTLYYRGPFYLDIDSDKIDNSIKSTRKLVTKLQSLGVGDNDIQLWATGKKGFHIIIDQDVFDGHKKHLALPLIYGRMANEIFVENLDMNIYSGGKGRMWRTPNIQRADNGKYKVPLTVAELENLDEEQYDKLVSHPRLLNLQPANVAAVGLTSLFLKAKKEVKKYLSERMAEDVKLDEESMASVTSEAGCIQKLIKEGDKDGRANFNQAAMQLGAFIAAKYDRSDRESYEPLIQTMANEVKSKAYKTVGERLEHIRGAVQRAFSDKRFVFSRKALFAVIRPCGNCPICKSPEGDSEELKDMDAIEARHTGYWMVGEKSDRQLTTFTITPLSSYKEQNEDQERAGRHKQTLNRRTGILARVSWLDVRGKVRHGTTKISDEAWSSRRAFVGALEGIDNCSVYLTDVELQYLKYKVFADMEDVHEVQEVRGLGFHWSKVAENRDVLVYVEPNVSLNMFAEQDSHTFVGRAIQPNAILGREGVEPGDEEIDELLVNMMHMNRPEVMAQTIGWFSACFINLQVKRLKKQFPALNLCGNAGSGKSQLAYTLNYLHGVDLNGRDSPASLESCTPYALVELGASSTTIPRILDECNESTVGKTNPRTWGKFIGLIKALWAEWDDSRGGLQKKNGQTTAGLETIRMTAPLCYCSEQMPEMPAIKQRSLLVPVTKSGRRGKAEEAYEEVQANLDGLADFGKMMTASAFRTGTGWVDKHMKHWTKVIPKQFDTRNRYSFAVAFTGLEFFKAVAQALHLEKAPAEAQRLIDTLEAYLTGEECRNINATQTQSEVDAIMVGLTVMARALQGEKERLVAEHHFFLRGNELLLDVPLVAHAHLKYVNSQRGRQLYSNAQGLVNMLKNEHYCIGIRPHPVMKGGKVLSMDMTLMEQEGFAVEAFKYELQ